MLSRRDWLRASLPAFATLLLARRADAVAPFVVTVYKDPGCQCCTQWVKHLSANGFVVTVHDVADMTEIKRTMRVPEKLQSCHTAVMGRYVIEGHVPATTIKKFVRTKPAALGLAVPGMPMGSPGMEGGRVDHYNVVSFDRDGTSRIFEKH